MKRLNQLFPLVCVSLTACHVNLSDSTESESTAPATSDVSSATGPATSVPSGTMGSSGGTGTFGESSTEEKSTSSGQDSKEVSSGSSSGAVNTDPQTSAPEETGTDTTQESTNDTTETDAFDPVEIDERSRLGQGYDDVGHTLRESCLDFNRPGYSVKSTPPSEASTFSVSLVKSNKHLAELLETSESISLGFKVKKLGLNFSANQQHFSSTVREHSHIRFVVSVKNRRENLFLNTPADSLRSDLVDNVLSPGSEVAKTAFRAKCGDGFVQSAELGSSLHLVFDFDTRSYSSSEVSTKKKSLEAAIRKAFKLGADSSSITALKKIVHETNTSISAHQVGGRPGLSVGVNPDNVVQRFEEFASDVNPQNYTVLRMSMAPYPVPLKFKGEKRDKVFHDISGDKGPKARMRRWAGLTVQVQARCLAWRDFDRPEPSNCVAARSELISAMELCDDPRRWKRCVNPRDYNAGGSTPVDSGANLLNWLASNVAKLQTSGARKDYDHHVHKGSKNVLDQTCLRSPDCFLDREKGAGDGLGKGFTIIESEYDNPKGGARTHRVSSSSPHCVDSSVRLKTGKPPFGDTTADWKYAVVLDGYCPVTAGFSVVQ